MRNALRCCVLEMSVTCAQAYDSKLSAWMTPVEIFSPHFSQALARYIASEAAAASSEHTTHTSASRVGDAHQDKHNSWRHRRRNGGGGDGGGGGKGGGKGREKGQTEQGLILYEVGGGSGTNALNVLNWLRREEPALYERTEYTIVEISERLAELQRERVCAVHEVRRARSKD